MSNTKIEINTQIAKDQKSEYILHFLHIRLYFTCYLYKLELYHQVFGTESFYWQNDSHKSIE